MEIRKLNSLRGLAALIVMVSHYCNQTKQWNGALARGGGHFGVMLFFILSAFLMTYCYLDMPPTKSALVKYLVARFSRVMPLFLTVVLTCFALNMGEPNTLRMVLYNIIGTKALMSHLLLLHGEDVLWTIPVEIHFYIIFAGIWLMRKYVGSIILAVLVIVLLGYLLVLWPVVPTTTIFGIQATFDIVRVLPYFIVGTLFAHAYKRWQAPLWLLSQGSVVALMVVPVFYLIVYHFNSDRPHRLWLEPGVLIGVSLIFFVIVFLLPKNSTVLENWIGDTLGKISYSLYLLHLPVILLLKKYELTDGFLGFALVLIVVLALAAISFLFFELPVRRKIRTFF